RNVEYVESFNRDGGGRGYKLTVNQFADLSEEEFTTSNYGLQSLPDVTAPTGAFSYSNNISDQDLPSYKDWREEGAATEVKNQRSCGCCWAFAAVAATEGITQIQTGQLISLSEQQLVDCDTATGNQGCDGGLAAIAFQYIESNGLTTEDEYPYQAKASGRCALASSTAATITGYEIVTPNNEQALLNAVAQQPVAVRVAAGSRDFQLYGGGVFTGGCGSQTNHAVTIVGYGTAADGIKYWIAKNSWGTDWGEDGYMRIQRDSEDERGMCLLATYPSYPVA
ncbi:hypothetical protein Taro_054665, partial [Colocasia esculenta]|nr:hypothetical protein [Colocasia esculenta]